MGDGCAVRYNTDMRPYAKKAYIAIALSLVFTLCFAGSLHADTKPGRQVLTDEEVFRLGERIYREGLLPSGKPLEAIVSGDVMVEGTMFSCASCHLRSGLGSFEGQVFSPPVNGRSLFMLHGNIPERVTYDDLLRFPPFIRPTVRKTPYTEKTLAEALRGGFSPSGREFNNAMPRYILSDEDMDVMVRYLRKLSGDLSPGVTPKEIRFATVIAGEVSREDKELLLTAVRSVVAGYNTRPELVMRLRREAAQKRRTGRVTHEGEEDRTVRTMTLDVWELKGPPPTWRGQLEELYRNKPVFGILSGISNADWSPVHKFCEQHQIPSLLPLTDYPVVSETDWFTLYLSKGFFQEGEAAARYLLAEGNLPPDSEVVQVYRSTPGAKALADGFRSVWEQAGGRLPAEVIVADNENIDNAFWRRIYSGRPPAAIMFWNAAPDLSSLKHLSLQPGGVPKVFVSYGLLREKTFEIPASARPNIYITYPYDTSFENRLSAMEMPWFTRPIPQDRTDRFAMIATIREILADIFMDFDRYYYRDYLLDIVGMMQDKSNMIPLYPRVSFGPGQRYAVKGCHVVQLESGDSERLIRKSDWLTN